jgi:asparagine synthase (glutamine-hydrolysing)
MCGIVAIFNRDGAPVREPTLLAMRDSLAHRGPDDAGLFLDGNVGLAHRRLRIIDLEGGRQPMVNSRGDVTVVFNGEIYNYRELRSMLISRGVSLRTQSDTETILGLYDLFGEDCVDHLRGMFAFALWDSPRRRLVAARDRLGIKPLYLYRRGSTIALASEIKAFLAPRDAAFALAEETVGEYLVFRSLRGTRTMFRDVERVAPGEMVVFDTKAVRRRRYWTVPLPLQREAVRRPAGEWAEELDSLLGQVTREHMVSDVPLGTFNSGGVDSSLITAYVAASAGSHLNTYSVGFDDPVFDERPYAKMVADRFKTNHHSPLMPPRVYAEWLPGALWHFDEPLNHPHSVHLAYLSRIAREKVTVVLTGEGSDELFAGYPRYRLPRVLDRMAFLGPFLSPSLRGASVFLGKRGRHRLRYVLQGEGGFRYDHLAAFVSARDATRVLAPAASVGLKTDSAEGRARAPGVLVEALRYDQENYLQALLNRLDKMNMSASLEGRVPFLDHLVVEFAARMPPNLKIRGLENKFLVKRVALRHLPETIVRRKKAGFAVPVAQWFRPGQPLAPYLEMLLEPRSLSRGYLNRAEVSRVVAEHRDGREDHGEILWGLTNLELWQRIMIEGALRPQGLQHPSRRSQNAAETVPR